MQLPLTLESLGDLDSGASRLVINSAIAHAVRDLDDRGDDGKPRKVQITLTLEQIDNGLVSAHIEAATILPKLRTAGTIGQFARSHGQTELLFQQFAPDRPDQRTIDEVERPRPPREHDDS